MDNRFDSSLLLMHSASESIVPSTEDDDDDDDSTTQLLITEVESAERELLQSVEAYNKRRSTNHDNNNYEPSSVIDKPSEEMFYNVIQRLLALPSSSSSIVHREGTNSIMDNNDGATFRDYEKEDTMNQLRSVVKQSKSRLHSNNNPNPNNNNIHSTIESKRSQRATRILDAMETLYQPLGYIYDDVIASCCTDALDILHDTPQHHPLQSGTNDKVVVLGEETTSTNDYSTTINAAYKYAKNGLSLLNRCEELYRETGETSQLPSISSYVSVMDVWTALLAANNDAQEEEEEEDTIQNNHEMVVLYKRMREEAMDVVKSLHSRRLEVYSFNNNGGGKNNGKYNILPPDITTNSNSVKKVLEYATNMIRRAVPHYKPAHNTTGDSSVGTWHFNRVIFDLAYYSQPFSGPLAQDLLEFMVDRVKEQQSLRWRSHKRRNSSNNKKNKQSSNDNDDSSKSSSSIGNNPIVPKPNCDTINGVLSAWKVTPNIHDAAQHAEAVLAQLAIWQSDGTLWGIAPDVISYNTCIACWKESGIPGCAARATEILTLLEANSTAIQPDEVTYASCIGAWAETAASDRGAGRKAEEILTRMYHRSKEDSSCPRPNTRCFNAVLLAYANGRESGGGKRALDLLRFMERLHSEGYADVQPDNYTLNIVMKALMNCGEEGAATKAKEILKRMETSYNTGDGSLKPNLLSYNTVLDSLAKKGDAISAEALLHQMYERTEARPPDAHSYTAVISAWAKHEDKVMAVKRAEDLVNDLESKWAAGITDTRPNTPIYNSLINCWAKSENKKTLYRVTQILDLMEELGLQGGDSDVLPNSRTYCAVLDALARSKNWKAYNESLRIIERMEELYEEGYESVRPCARAYSIVISTIARSRKKGKAIKAQEILHRMENEYRKGNAAARPTVYSYNAVINAAAYTSRGDEKEQEEAFKVACLTFDQLRMSDYLKPSHVSYGTLRKAIQNHFTNRTMILSMTDTVAIIGRFTLSTWQT